MTNGGFESDRRIMSFINSDQFANDSNKTCEVLMKVLEFCQEKLKKLPKNLFIQTDNCSKASFHYSIRFYFFIQNFLAIKGRHLLYSSLDG